MLKFASLGGKLAEKTRLSHFFCHGTFAIKMHYFTGQRNPSKPASYQAPHRRYLYENDLDFDLLNGSKPQQGKLF